MILSPKPRRLNSKVRWSQIPNVPSSSKQLFFNLSFFTSTALSSYSHVKMIPDTGLLVSLHHHWRKAAQLEVFDVSKKGLARKIYSFGEVFGGN